MHGGALLLRSQRLAQHIRSACAGTVHLGYEKQGAAGLLLNTSFQILGSLFFTPIARSQVSTYYF